MTRARMPDGKTVGRNAGEAGFEFAVLSGGHPVKVGNGIRQATVPSPFQDFGAAAMGGNGGTIPAARFIRRIDRPGLIARN